MDRGHVESRDWLRQDQSWLQELLCRASCSEAASSWYDSISKWIPPHASAQSPRITDRLEEAQGYFCEFDERLISQKCPSFIHQASLCCDAGCSTTSVSDPYKAC